MIQYQECSLMIVRVLAQSCVVITDDDRSIRMDLSLIHISEPTRPY